MKEFAIAIGALSFLGCAPESTTVISACESAETTATYTSDCKGTPIGTCATFSEIKTTKATPFPAGRTMLKLYPFTPYALT